MHEIAQKDPELFKELVQKRSLRFKDPSRSYSQTFPLHELPKKAVMQVITPAVLRNDQKACQSIIERI